MMKENRKIVLKEDALNILGALGEEFAIVHNPDYVHPEVELYPLANKITGPLDSIAAVLMDMDGTTTTTEELCIHSLEFMIRRMSNRLDKSVWGGLDHNEDYPHIIGNSTTKHVEYLIRKYQTSFIIEHSQKAFLHSALWTLILGKDKQRQEDVRNNLNNLNLSGLLEDPKYLELKKSKVFAKKDENIITDYFFEKYSNDFSEFGFNEFVRIGIDIYYQRYHQILERMKQGEGQLISEELFNDKDKHLIEPMPGVEIFLPMVKGWLGKDVEFLFEEMIDCYEVKSGENFNRENLEQVKADLVKVSSFFENSPAKVAIVTSSIFYEADIVIAEVFRVLCSRFEKMNLPEAKKQFLKNKFSDYKNFYDSVVTASDSNEIRLKPHRDLYSIALHQVGIPKDKFRNVIGFEDSESGTIAIRAAGIGLCVAVPFAQTSGHNFEAATFICKGGLPETLLKHKLFLI